MQRYSLNRGSIVLQILFRKNSCTFTRSKQISIVFCYHIIQPTKFDSEKCTLTHFTFAIILGRKSYRMCLSILTYDSREFPGDPRVSHFYTAPLGIFTIFFDVYIFSNVLKQYPLKYIIKAEWENSNECKRKILYDKNFCIVFKKSGYIVFKVCLFFLLKTKTPLLTDLNALTLDSVLILYIFLRLRNFVLLEYFSVAKRK